MDFHCITVAHIQIPSNLNCDRQRTLTSLQNIQILMGHKN